MILYHVDSQYQLLCAMTHKLLQDEEADIIMHREVLQRFEKKQLLKIRQLFANVIIVDPFFRYRNTKDVTAAYYSQRLDVDSYTDIYVWGAHRSFGYYLAENRIPFIFGEEGNGFISRPYILEEWDKKIKILGNHFDSIRQYGLYDGIVENAKGRMYSFQGQVGGFPIKDGDVDFEVIDALGKLTPEMRKKLMDIFVPVGEIRLPDDAIIFMTQHLSFLGTVSFEEQILLTQLFVDYFLHGQKLVFKPHPNDLTYYSKLFPDVQIIRQVFPAEFFPYIFNPQPLGLASISSNAVRILKEHYGSVMQLDDGYVSDYKNLHKYYAAVSIARRLQLPIYCWDGTNRTIVRALLQAEQEKEIELSDEMSETCVILVDRMIANREESSKEIQAMLKMLGRIQRLAARICVVFLNSENDYCWYGYGQRELWEHMVPLVLRKERIRQDSSDFYADMEQEVMYVFSYDEEILKMAKETEIHKELPHVGLSFTTACLPQNEETIKILEGVLAATERRLLYYVEKEKQERTEMKR